MYRFVVSALALIAAPTFLHSATIVDDTFSYPVGADLGSQSGWTNLNSGDNVTVVAGNLTATGYRPSTGNSVSFGGNGFDPYRSFSATVGTVYYSFLVQFNNLGTLDTTGGYFAGLGSNTTILGAVLWARSDGASGVQLGLGKRSGSTPDNVEWSSTSYSAGSTIVIVGSYTYNNFDDDDLARLWINPAPSTFGLSAPTATLMTSTGLDLDAAGINRFFFRQDSAAHTAANLQTDELRVGTSYADVTATPEPASATLLLLSAGLLAGRRRRR